MYVYGVKVHLSIVCNRFADKKLVSGRRRLSLCLYHSTLHGNFGCNSDCQIKKSCPGLFCGMVDTKTLLRSRHIQDSFVIPKPKTNAMFSVSCPSLFSIGSNTSKRAPRKESMPCKSLSYDQVNIFEFGGIASSYQNVKCLIFLLKIKNLSSFAGEKIISAIISTALRWIETRAY